MSDKQPQEGSHTCQHSHATPEGQRTESTLQPQPNSEASSPRKFQPIHFLVAEDNKVNQKLFTRMIDRLGHDCDLVVNGEEAVEAYKQGHRAYQCILMDVSMPVMGGIEATELIRAFEEENSLEHGYIVALVAGMRSSEKDRMQKLGFTTAIRKPLTLKDLNSLLEELGILREV